MSSSLTKALALAVRTGKVVLGFKEAIEALRGGKAKMIIMAKNLPEELKGKLESMSKLAGIPILESEASSLELGAACGKPHTVSALAIRDPGDSDILSFASASKRRRRSG